MASLAVRHTCVLLDEHGRKLEAEATHDVTGSLIMAERGDEVLVFSLKASWTIQTARIFADRLPNRITFRGLLMLGYEPIGFSIEKDDRLIADASTGVSTGLELAHDGALKRVMTGYAAHPTITQDKRDNKFKNVRAERNLTKAQKKWRAANKDERWMLSPDATPTTTYAQDPRHRFDEESPFEDHPERHSKIRGALQGAEWIESEGSLSIEDDETFAGSKSDSGWRVVKKTGEVVVYDPNVKPNKYR